MGSSGVMKIKLVVAFAISVAALSGCSTKYHCNKFPTGNCENMGQVYDRTGGGFKDYRDTGHIPVEGQRRNGGKTVIIGNPVNKLNELQPGDAVLTTPQVMRVWFKPWPDKDGDLNYSFTYIKVRESEWTVLK